MGGTGSGRAQKIVPVNEPAKKKSNELGNLWPGKKPAAVKFIGSGGGDDDGDGDNTNFGGGDGEEGVRVPITEDLCLVLF